MDQRYRFRIRNNGASSLWPVVAFSTWPSTKKAKFRLSSRQTSPFLTWLASRLCYSDSRCTETGFDMLGRRWPSPLCHRKAHIKAPNQLPAFLSHTFPLLYQPRISADLRVSRSETFLTMHVVLLCSSDRAIPSWPHTIQASA